MSKQSAGILLYRNINKPLEVFLVHPGGPFFKNKDEGSWSIPKGEFLDDEEALAAAKRSEAATVVCADPERAETRAAAINSPTAP